MKKRMRHFAMIAILALVMNSLAGCGNVEYIDAMADETEDYAESYGIEVTVTPVVEEDESVVEDEVIVEDESVVEDEVAAEEIESAKTESTVTAPTETAAPARTAAPAQPASTPEPAVPVQSEPAQSAPEPVHTHDWKEHTATEQTWVPNIVTIDDYEETYTESYEFICDCDFTTTDRDVIADHVYDTMHGFTIHTIRHGEQVKVGSHEEDMGHYETSTYVDYYYCDCGATK